MKITWKVVYAFLCFLAVFLIPLAYADENVSVYFCKDGEKVEAPAVGDKVMVHSEIIGASSSDHITLTLQDSSLKFSSNPGSKTTNVYGRYAGDNVWIYEAEVEVLSENPALPTAQYVRDSSQPELTSTEKPTGVSIDLNSEQIVSPGDTIHAKATLEPSATVDPAYYNYLEWSVAYGDTIIELDKPRGEAIEFTIPDSALNNSIEVKAVLKGQECGLNDDIAAKTVQLKVNDESLSIQIFPSTDSEGVVVGKYLGFSSELLRNGKVAEESAREGITYWWTAQIGQQFVNGQKRNSPTYVISPEETGTLTVYLSVTLPNGITLESNHVTKTVVNSDSTLESVEIKQLETGEVKVGDTVSVTYTLKPNYVTNLDSAKYEWKAVSGDKTIATSDKLEDFNFTVTKAGIVSVTLTITLDEKDPIESNTLDINVLETTPTKIYSGDIKTDQDTNNLKVGDTLTLNADLVTEGGENINYSWKATNSSGETIGESNELKNFSITSQKEEDITVTFLAEVDPQSITEEVDDSGFKAIKLIESYSFKSQDAQSTVTNNETNDSSNSNNGQITEGRIEVKNDTNNSAENIVEDKTVSSEKTNEVIQNGETNKQPAVSSDEQNVEKVKTEITKEPVPTSAGSETDLKETNEDSTSKDELITENTTKQISKTSNSADTKSNPSSTVSTNKETGAVKTSSSNSAPATSKQLSPSSNGTTQTLSMSNSTPKGAQSSSSTTSNVFNKNSNVVNPKTGTNFTVGQLLVISVCSTLIFVSTILLFRKDVNPN